METCRPVAPLTMNVSRVLHRRAHGSPQALISTSPLSAGTTPSVERFSSSTSELIPRRSRSPLGTQGEGMQGSPCMIANARLAFPRCMGHSGNPADQCRMDPSVLNK